MPFHQDPDNATTEETGGHQPKRLNSQRPVVGTFSDEMSEFAPMLWVDEIAGRVRLCLDGVASAEGATLQEAADELVWKILVAAMALRDKGITAFSTACRPKQEVLDLLWEIGGLAAVGGDIRERLFGPSSLAA